MSTETVAFNNKDRIVLSYPSKLFRKDIGTLWKGTNDINGIGN